MAAVWFAGDLHLGHKNICKFREHFTSEEEHREAMIRMINAKASKRDTIIFTGDCVLDKVALDAAARIQCGNKILVLGNHCTERVHINYLTKVFNQIHGMMKYKEFWVTHAPMHPAELRGKKNVHGHVHTATLDDPRYLNTSIDSGFMNYEIRTLEEVRAEFKRQCDPWKGEVNTAPGDALDSWYMRRALYDVRTGMDTLGLDAKYRKQGGYAKVIAQTPKIAL